MPLLVLIAFGALLLGVVALARIADLRRTASDTRDEMRRLGYRVEALQREIGRLRGPTNSPPQVAAPEPGQRELAPGTRAQELAPGPRAQELAPGTKDQEPGTAPPARPGPPALPAPPARPARPARPTISGVDWESLVGVKLFSWIAAIALTLGAVFFLRYSIQAGWLQPPVRMAIGIVAGLALLAGCEMRVARNYPITANALDASGIVILFATFFAAFALWHLVGVAAAFLFLSLVTIVAVLLAIRRNSLFIAILGLLGGFLTPALLSTGQDNPVGLFGYLLLLNAGLDWVASRKRWALLTGASVVLTTAYQWSWVAKFLTEGKLALAALIFLVFPVLGFSALALGRRSRAEDQRDGTFRVIAGANGLLPLLFALYLAEVPEYAAHGAVLFGFLFCVDALLLIASLGGSRLLHLAGGAATNLVFLVYLALSYEHGAWPGVLGTIALFVAFYLGSALVWPGLAEAPSADPSLRREVSPYPGIPGVAALQRAVPYVGAMLLFTFPLLIALEPATASPAPVFVVLFLLLAAAAVVALVERRAGVHFVAAFFALAAQAAWSGRFLTDARLLPALTVYLVFALFYIGVPMLARRLERPLRPQSAGVVILIVSLALLFFPAGFLAGDAALWGLALLVAILNVAVFVEGTAAKRPALSLIASALSWLVICVWWTRANEASLTGPGLLVVAGFAMLTFGGHIWNSRRSSRQDALAQNGIYLGLVGHLFLLFVAGQPALSIPPWPMLAVLAVLDLAAGAAALYARQANLHLAAIAASALVLLAWLAQAVAPPWPATVLGCAAGLALMAAAWMWLARRVGGEAPFLVRIDAGAALALLLALLIAMFASDRHAPALPLLALAHAAFLAALLAVAAFRRWHKLAVAAVVPTAIAVATWHAGHPEPGAWASLLLFSAAIYACFLLYPLLLGRRVGTVIEPHLAAVLASAVFFFAARHSLTAGGYGDLIGILPVSQALLMAVLLWDLLRIEPRASRAKGRLALVAGAALAFVTVAIPLQLEKEWITIGWALEGASLAWLYGRIRHRGLLYGAGGLLAAVFVRLAFNPAVLVYEPRGEYAIWNWYLYTYVMCAAAMLVAARLFAATDDALVPGSRRLPRLRSLAASGGTILLFLLVNIEIADFYSTGTTITFNLAGTLAQDMTYTLCWGVFAVALLVAGIVIRSRPARAGAIALLAVTVIKGFLHDLARLGGLYRVASFVGLAICLALVAVVLQKFVLRGGHPELREPVRGGRIKA